jgi:hypothetical protein
LVDGSSCSFIEFRSFIALAYLTDLPLSADNSGICLRQSLDDRDVGRDRARIALGGPD